MTLVNFNSNGNLTVTLPLGNVNNEYRIFLSVRVFNDLGGYVMYNLSQSLQVFANIETTSFLISQVIADPSLFSLSNKNILQSAPEIIGLTSVLNSLNYTNNSQVN
jgi:hypothetical protein